MNNFNEDLDGYVPSTLDPWETLERRRPSRVRILRALVAYREPMYEYYRELLVPGRPAPTRLGAVLLLWERWIDARSRCTRCGALGMITSFGGLLSVGSMSGWCLGCEHVVQRRTGGFGVALLAAQQALAGSGYALPLAFPQGWSLGGSAWGLVAALQEVGAEGLSYQRRVQL